MPRAITRGVCFYASAYESELSTLSRKNKNASPKRRGTFCALCDPAGISCADPSGQVKPENAKCHALLRVVFVFTRPLTKASFRRYRVKTKMPRRKGEAHFAL